MSKSTQTSSMDAGIWISSINSVKPNAPALQQPDPLENDAWAPFSSAGPKW
jgi:hypothetical protein